MKIKRLVIENFKSIERIELIEPNPFTVFVGPNGSGKSNIFEALEFVNSFTRVFPREAVRQFGGAKKLANRGKDNKQLFKFEAEFDRSPSNSYIRHNFFESEDFELFTEFKGIPTGREREERTSSILHKSNGGDWEISATEQFFLRFLRIFVKNGDVLKSSYQDDISLDLAATNLEPVLKRILIDNALREEIFEWLDLFIPGFKSVEIDDRNELHWFEKSSLDYFTKDLISDGTYNILALLTAVYQSEKPQFLCIEEPENGLHPLVIESLISFFRNVCAEKGHYIWLNTHSASLVSQLRPDEIVLVEKHEGSTITKQVGNRNLYNLQTDYAWLSGALGGGLPW